MANEDQTNDNQADPSPANQADDKVVKTFTADEVDQKLRGSGKVIESLKAELETLKKAEEDRKQKASIEKKKRLEEAGKFKELHEAAEAKIKDLEGQLGGLTQKETARLEALAEQNEARKKALPKDLRDLVMPGLTPDQLADQLNRLEAVKAKQTINVHGGPPRAGKPATPEDFAADIEKKGHEFIFGEKGKK
jgi:hypothetical protein